MASITPGPNNMMLMASGVNHGIKKSIPHYLGICFGFPAMVAVVGFGVGGVFARYPDIFLYLKVAGVSYLLYLAWKIANAGNQDASVSIRNPFSFIQATGFQWLNPKAWAMVTGTLAVFADQNNFYSSVVSIVLVYFFMGLLCMAVWLKVGQTLRLFLNTESRVRFFNISMAILLVLSVIPILLTRF